MEKKETVVVDSDLKGIIPLFFKNRESDIEVLKESLANKKYEKIEQIGHQLKGAGGSYGFDYISEIGKKIEDLASESNTIEIRQLINELESYVNTVEISYD
ncbi:Hpt domain-containing protein [Halanaerobiaceae bacterium Z-7014]|uniref:Hpt domain-containing protein n=1 Tax=Halonatronomonas betaini TaxID=2778430 RepID=A0A931F6C8_9FIRM|nr:Hpt domain-containing protein [Halonatronomonas betaini]MBF8435446.1 Hpt domain-containing protein [Halonatronomonas betaini]